MSWLKYYRAEINRGRQRAKERGHDLTRTRVGDTSAIASCRNHGCSVMMEFSEAGLIFFDLKSSDGSTEDPGPCENKPWPEVEWQNDLDY